MAEMGNYCKAYHVSDFRKFDGWKEKVDDLRGEKRYEDGKEIVESKTELNDDDILYVQENYVVTHGIFKDEHIVYDEATDAWKDFCHKELKFEIPDYAKPEKAEQEAVGAGNGSEAGGKN